MSGPWDDLEQGAMPQRSRTPPGRGTPGRVHRFRAGSHQALSALRLWAALHELVQDPRPVPPVRTPARARGGRVPRRDDDQLHVHGVRLGDRAHRVARPGSPRPPRAGAHDHVDRDRGVGSAAVLAVLQDDLGERRLPGLPDEPRLRLTRGRRPRERQRRPFLSYSRQGSRTPRSAATASASS